MAIEIKELIIKITVSDKSQNSSEAKSIDNALKKKIIDECIDKVLEKIEAKHER